MTIKILNLYAGIGGNRKLWDGDIEVTAVEIIPSIAKAYSTFYPKDKVIIEDAHQYLLEHYKEFDFIWSSPPCPTHSRLKLFGVNVNHKVEYPDMTLYQEILFLKHFFKGLFVVENTISYYDPLIRPYVSGSHYFWSNFPIIDYKVALRSVSVNTIKEKQEILDIDLSDYSFNDMDSSHKKDKVLNNCVEPELGLHIFKMAFKDKQEVLRLNV